MTDLPQDALRESALDELFGEDAHGYKKAVMQAGLRQRAQSELAALRQRCELLEANLHVQGEYLAGALADVERAERDAMRYHVLRDNVCGSTMGHFSFAWFPKLPTNWRQGSIAQHFDAALDAIAANSTPQRAPEDQT